MKAKLIVVSMLSLVLSLPTLAIAAAPGTHFFDCKDCHLTGLTVSQLQGGPGGNVCLKCHDTDAGNTTTMNAGNLQGYIAAVKSSGQFSAGDASNQYGNNPAPGSQTSHNWAATAINPAAGANNPSRTLHKFMSGYRGRNASAVNCARCHNPHAAYSASNPKMLPMQNDGVTPMTANDMCIACHTDFNIGSSSHGLLSHPIGMVYSSVVSAKPGEYQAAPVGGELALMADGTLSCITCHGVHATDSDATTTDGFAGSPGAGDGLLLKHNGPSKEDPALGNGICQACHIYEGHGVGGANDMGCMVCHGGHAYDDTAPNYYMLNKTIDMPFVPKLGGPGTVTLDYTADPTSVSDYNNGTGANGALCLACHDLPGTHNTGDACADCHSHNSTTGSFGAGCGSCHGYAPYLNAAGNLTSGGYAADTVSGWDYQVDSGHFKDESATPHARHANGTGNYSFSCQNCHGTLAGDLSDTTNHNAGSFRQVLDTAIGALPALPKTGGMTPLYNETFNSNQGSCSAVYCHSNGRVTRAPENVTPTQSGTPVWGAGAGTISNCTTCHNIGASATDSATHDIHIAKYACGVCHNNTSADGSSLAAGAIGGTHVNGVVDAAGSGLAIIGGVFVYDDTQGTCANYCHSDGKGTVKQTPDWDLVNTGNCGDCHGGPTGADSVIASGSHTKHLSAGLSCNDCHGANAITGNHVGHLDGDGPNNIDVVANCNTCHGSDGVTSHASAPTDPDRMPVWGLPASVDCETCHAGSNISSFSSAAAALNGKVAPDKDTALSTGHGKATGTYPVTGKPAANKDCTVCHDSTTAGHFDGISNDDDRLFAGFACLNCHDGSVSTQVMTHTNIGATIKTETDFTKLCLDCHNPHGSATNAAMISVPGVVFTAGTGTDSYDEADLANADDICATCHTTTSHNFAAESSTNSHNQGADCTGCHNHLTGFMATGGSSCEDCHSAKLAQPRHAAHINTTPSVDADKSECAICHPSAAAYTITGGSTDHFNNSANDFSANITNPEAAGTTCSSAMGCHLSTVSDGFWQDTNGLECDACHYEVANPTQAGNTGNANPISAGHNAHFAGGGQVVCGDCHNAVTDTTHISNAAGTDGAVLTDKANAVQAEATVIAGMTFSTVADTCATASCHNDARPGASVTTAAWGSNQANCTQCHAASPTTGSHGVHILDATNCSTCHTSALKDTSYNSANHIDSDIDVAAGGYPNNRAQNSAFTNCTSASCHDDGRNGGVTPTWGAIVDNCAECHATAPTTGSHTAHLTATTGTAACGDCHTGTTQGSAAPTANHRDGFVNATGYPVQEKGLTYTNCATASCHNDGRNGGLTQDWGTALTACDECHATVPTTGGHGKHVGVSFGGSTIACGSCHAGAVQGTTKPTANHRDGFTNATGYPVTTNGGVFQTCSTASCHRKGQDPVAANDYTVTPAWDGDLANCTQCHAASPTTGSHTKHLISSNCSACHTNALKNVSYIDAAHGDGNVDVAVGTYTANKAYGAAEESCASINCHSDGFSGATGGTPVWGTASGCAACHLDDMTRGSHGPHLADNNDCGTCHADTVKAVSAPTGGIHADGNVDVFNVNAGDLGYPTTAAYGSASWTTCSAATCHDAGREVNLTPAWGTPVTDCSECHGKVPPTGSHASHVADAAVTCTNCHTGAAEGTTAPTTGHRDGNIDVTAGTYPLNKIKGSALTNCTTASCHNDGRGSAVTATWGTVLPNCGECHAVAPTTGSHTSHLADALVNCIDCHAAAVEGTTAPSTGHRDGNIDVDGTGYTVNKGLGTAFTTCATASCHNDGRNSGLTTVWGTPRNNCSECHATAPTTGSHTDHLALYACATCHTGTTQGTTAGAGHRDGNITTAASTGLGAKVKGTAYTSCGTNNCHGSGSPVWGTDLDGNDACTQCHGQLVAGPATDAQKAPGGAGVDTNGDSAATDAQVGAHQIHLNPTKSRAVACVACHQVPATVNAAGHIDSALPAELTWGGVATANSTIPTSCATTYCHDGSAIKNGWDGGTLAPVWTNTAFMQGTVADCDNCHGYPPPATHPANSDCSACHDVMNADDLTFTAAGKLTHVDGNVNASGGDNCSDCHAADLDGALNGAHAAHVDTSAYLTGKTLSGNDYGGTGWYTTTYVSGQPQFGCGQCHPANETLTHPTAGLNLDIDPAGETPGAGNVKTFNNAQSTPTFITRSSITCASVYCHSDAAGSFKTTPNWYGGALPTDGTECASCHGNSPTTAAHGVHEVGIHYTELYDDDGVGLMAPSNRTADLTASGGSDAAHGNPATSSTINCYTCHSGTVIDSANALNTTCVSCHSDSNSIITGNEAARISTTSSTHLNGVKDVVFADLTVFKSKAQLRDNLSDADDGSNILSNLWKRLAGEYKAADGGSFDTYNSAVVPTFTQGPDTCSTVACHNGNTATWSDTAVDCLYCHTSLPK